MFNFAQARVKCAKVGATVHVVKALIGMKEATQKYSPDDVVLSTAISYIKALEAEVTRLESTPVVLNAQTVNVSASFDDSNPKGFAQTIIDSFGRGALGRVLGGNQ
jgi:hypothetical protein